MQAHYQPQPYGLPQAYQGPQPSAPPAYDEPGSPAASTTASAQPVKGAAPMPEPSAPAGIPQQYEPYNPVYPVLDHKSDSNAELAPPPPEYDRGLDNLTYDQVVNWWNLMTVDQRDNMYREVGKLSREQLAELRRVYQRYIPREYYPKETFSPDRPGACDYYLMFYLCEDLALQVPWFNANGPLKNAFYAPPPSFEESQQSRQQRLPPPTVDDAQKWWDSLPRQQQEALSGRSQNYKPADIAVIRREFRPYYRYYRPVYMAPELDFYDYYLMSRYHNRFYGYPFFYRDYFYYNDLYLTMRMTELAVRGGIQLGGLAVRGAIGAARLVGSGLQAAGRGLASFGGGILDRSGGSSSNSSDATKAFIAIGVILAAVATACSAAVASLYSGIKAAASLENLGKGRKVLRSLFRLGAMAGGGYLGAVEGAVVGAVVGSVVPGIGTAAGAIIGAIFGAPITAAVAGYVAKQISRLVSKYWTGSTNPEKWDVAKAQRNLVSHQVHMSTDEINEMFAELRKQKQEQHQSSWNFAKGALPKTKHKSDKERYNKFLDAVVNEGIDPRRGIRVDEHTRFRWDGQRKQIERIDVELPRLAVGPRV